MLNSNSDTVSLLIASPSTLTCQLLAAAFTRQSKFRVVARVASIAELLPSVVENPIDVVLVSETLQDGPQTGIAAITQLREHSPGTKTVLLVETPTPQTITTAFRAGAKGVFSPSCSEFKLLCKCVDRVQAGQIWATSDELSHVMEAFAQMSPLRIVNSAGKGLLTKREDDVARLVAEGLGNREIAHELKLSEHTVKNYLFRIFDKLGVSSRVELVLYAVSNSKRVISPVIEMNHQGGRKMA